MCLVIHQKKLLLKLLIIQRPTNPNVNPIDKDSKNISGTVKQMQQLKLNYRMVKF